MNNLRKLIVIVASLVALAACAKSMAPAAPDTAADKTAIDDVEATFVKAFNAGDGAAVAALYAEDAVLNAPGIPALRGRASIQEFLAKDAAEAATAGRTESDGPTSEVGVSGDLACGGGHTRPPTSRARR